MTAKRKQVLVLGGGFGGVTFCQKFSAEDVDITLIDRQNHHLFQPLLYQVATAGLGAPDIAQPIRDILADERNVRVVMDEVCGIDLGNREVRGSAATYPYDYLVIGLGAVTSFFGNDEWGQHVTGLKTLDEAASIRRRLLLGFERAELCDDPAERARLMTVVVVGGGPTGVEMAGAIAELVKRVLVGSFRKIDPSLARVVLVEAAPGVLTMFPQSLQSYTADKLTEMGVELRLGEAVREVGERRLVVGDGEVIEAETIIWAAGIEASPVAKTTGVELDRRGRIEVEDDLSVPGYPEVFAIGDIAHLVDAAGVEVPGVSPAAMQMAKHAASVIERDLSSGRDPAARVGSEKFIYFNKGEMATIGRSAAVAKVGQLKLNGWLAWMAWLFVHLMFLVGFRNKAVVFVQWVWSYVTFKRGARLITGINGAGVGRATAR